jgi:FAD-linked oxidoreductase
VQRAVMAAVASGLHIKAVGSGHSSSGISAAPGVQLDLHDMGGLIDVDAAAQRVRVGAGTLLCQLNSLLAPRGMSLPHVGDIGRQTVAGALSTGTHGTGSVHRGLSSHVAALTLVTADGSLLRVSGTENADLFPAVCLGLGALGIIVDVTLQCVPPGLLHVVKQGEMLTEVLEGFSGRVRGSDHFAFSWLPHTGLAMTTASTQVSPEGRPEPRGRMARFIGDELMENGVKMLTSGIGAVVPAFAPQINRITARVSGGRDYTEAVTRVLASSRRVRVQEMEYALPLAAVPSAFVEVHTLIERRGWRISFPLRVRTAAAETAWLSPSGGRESGHIAIPWSAREDSSEYFRAVEAILRAHGGRPHWGKIHQQDAVSLARMYPHFDDFLAVRERLDPERSFGNPYLARVLGP